MFREARTMNRLWVHFARGLMLAAVIAGLGFGGILAAACFGGPVHLSDEICVPRRARSLQSPPVEYPQPLSAPDSTLHGLAG
jgi:hypothetical protein